MQLINNSRVLNLFPLAFHFPLSLPLLDIFQYINNTIVSHTSFPPVCPSEGSQLDRWQDDRQLRGYFHMFR